MSRFARILLVAAGLLAAPVLYLQAEANAGKPGLTFHWNGFNLEQMAFAGLQIDQSAGSVSVGVDENAEALAARAFASEPLASDALFVMAVGERAAGNQQRMLSFVEGANALDKRNSNIGAFQMEQAILAGDLPQAFLVLDRLAKVHPRLTPRLVQPLVAALGQDGADEVIGAALAEQPRWAREFWRSVPSDPELVSSMFELRQNVSFATTPESDARLLAALVAQGRFEESFAFWDQVNGEDDHPFGFFDQAAFAPFGWQLHTSGERAMSARGDGLYDVYVQAESAGLLGRQLLRLPSGAYRFAANIAPQRDAPSISAALICAEDNQPVGDAQSLQEPAVWNVTGDCSAYWLELEGSAWSVRDALRVTVSAMRFGLAD